jgi:hypothetical protein
MFGCGGQTGQANVLQNRIDSLQSQLEHSYKPGFGDFMGRIQVHHNKLWFAGQNQNWKLADFEVHEISEAISDIQTYQAHRKESQMIAMILPPLDSVDAAIEQKNLALFRRSYTLLTNTCNNCHRAANFEFNIVKIPSTPPFSNQEFNYRDEK